MTFVVPQGGSAVCHIEVEPLLPLKGVAQDWPMTEVSSGAAVNRLDVDFQKASTPSQRLDERMILVFCIADSAQTNAVSWRFIANGVMYCEGKADYLDDAALEVSNDGKVLTATIKCLTDIPEDVNFSFLALRRDNTSGECAIYASADPGGTYGRR